MRLVTVDELEERIRFVTDTDNNKHTSTPIIRSFLNQIYPVYWELLVSADCPDLEAKTVTYSASAFEVSLDTVCPDEDFYKLRAIHANYQESWFRINRFNEDHMPWRELSQTIPLRLEYYPNCPRLTDGDSTVNGYSGWEEFLVQATAKEIKKRRQEDYVAYAQDAMMWSNLIKNSANKRDLNAPMRIISRRNHHFESFRYRLFAGNLQMVELDDSDRPTYSV